MDLSNDLRINIPINLDFSQLDNLRKQLADINKGSGINMLNTDVMQKDLEKLKGTMGDLAKTKFVSVDGKKTQEVREYDLAVGQVLQSTKKLGAENNQVTNAIVTDYRKIAQQTKQTEEQTKRLVGTFTELKGGQATASSVAQTLSKEYGGLIVKERSLDEVTGRYSVTLAKNAKENLVLKGTLNSVNGQLHQNSKVTKDAIRDQLGWADAMKIALKRTVQWSMSMGLVYGAMRQVKSGIGYLLEIDKEMTNLQKVTDATAQEYKNFETVANQLGSSLGKSTQEVVNSAAEFARLGFDLRQSAILAKEALLFSNVGDFGIEDATTSLISTVKGFGIAVDDQGKNIRAVVDMSNEVANNFAISQEGISGALQRSASSLHVAGNTIEESIAMITAANSVIQNPEKVGNGLTFSPLVQQCA